MNKMYFIFLFFIFLFFFSTVSSLSVTANIPEKYTDVEAGERFYFEISVKYPENPQRKDLKLEYSILDEENHLIAQSKVLKAVETQASFIDFIVIPQGAKNGLHFINVKISDYEELNEEVSATFNVTSGMGNNLQLYFIVLLSAVLIVGLFVVISIRRLKKK